MAQTRVLYEREHELSVADGAIALAAEGEGSLLLIEGPPGIGKTQLLSAVRERASGAGLAVAAARGGVLDAEHAYGATRTLLGLLVKRGREAGEEMPLITGAATWLFDPSAPPAPGRPGEPSHAVLTALCEIVLHAARTQPLLLSLDDAQWVDAETLRLLTSLARHLQEAGVLLAVGAHERGSDRARQQLAVLASDPATTALRLSPLSRHGVASLLAGALGETPDMAFVAACETATGGNPFLLTELIRTLAADRLRPIAGNVAKVSGYLPPGISRAVLARLARLTPEARRVAAALAVLGGKADWNVLADIAELDRDEVAEAFDLLDHAGVVLDGESPGFSHPIIRAAIYEDLPRHERDRAHRRAARRLAEAPGAGHEDIAAHLLAARPGGDPWVVGRLREAGDRALAQGAAETACRYLRRALAEPPPTALAGELLARLSEAHSRLGDAQAAAASAQAALDATEDPAARGQIALAVSSALVRANRPREAITVLHEAIAALPESEESLGRRMESELEVISHLSGLAGRTVRGREARFPPGADETPRDQSDRLALAGQADAEMNRGRAEEAGRLALLALDDEALLRDEGARSVLFFSTAIVLLYSDHLDEAERAYTEALGYAREAGLPGIAMAAEGFLAGVAHRRGSLRDAEDHARSALTGITVSESPLRGVFATAFLVNALVDRGELGHALRALEQTGADGALPDALITNILQHARGRLRSATGDHAAALADHLACGRRAEEWAMHTPAVENWHSLAATELAALGRREEALAHATAGTEVARAFNSPRALGAALITEGSLRGETPLLEEAAGVLEGSPARLVHAHALVALGAAERRAGRRARAREILTHGLRLARVCGAVPLAREADAELTVLGSRSRRMVRAGVAELTASERRVAELAANGLANQQIAEALVVSVRTVETHLAHTYQKLDISSRRALAGALGRTPPGEAQAPAEAGAA